MVMSNQTSSDEIAARLGVTAGARRRGLVGRWLLTLAIVIGVLGMATVVSRSLRAEPAVRYQTENAEKGTLTVTVTATGELTSLTQVNIGTEISGIVESVNVDFNSPVRVGDVLARVNTEKLEAQAAQARAALQSAEARRQQSQATLAEAQAAFARLKHVSELSGGRVPSRNEMDAQEASLKRAQADEASSGAQVAQSQASLSAIETDMRKAVIRSPIAGIVLDRQVDPGQTVAASFQTPTLFTLAEDLTRMKLIVDIDEADIGSVRVAQAARFRVDAYPDRTFESTVRTVRSTPKTSNGVVTYQTVLTVDNAERLLQPGMTATAEITVTQVPDALLVPNTALRFTPPVAAEEGGGFRLLPRPPGQGRRDRSAETGAPRVWTLVGQDLVPVELALGPTNGRLTVVRSGELAPGTPLIVDLATN
jgi:HlyD family secretion protein